MNARQALYMRTSRRGFLSTFPGYVAVAAGSAVWMMQRPAAAAFDASLSQRMERLYAGELEFDGAGYPVLRVGLLEGVERCEVTAVGGVDLSPAGLDGPALAGMSRWHVRAEHGRPALVDHHVELESLPDLSPKTIESRSRLWDSRGQSNSVREIGTTFGSRGRLIDNRRSLLLGPAYRSAAQADAAARELASRHGIAARRHARLVRRPEGSIIAKDSRFGAQIRTRGELWLRPTTAEVIQISSLTHSGERHTHKLRGALCLTLDAEGRLCIVNRIRERDLLAGLVPTEIYADSAPAALQAQAIVARGQILAKLGLRHQTAPYHLCAHTHCQVYGGAGRERPATDAAVEHTHGTVLLRPGNSALVDSVYSANAGGHTANNETVWPGRADAQLRGRPDPKLPGPFSKGISPGNIGEFVSRELPSFARPTRRDRADSYRWQTQISLDKLVLDHDVARRVGRVEDVRVLSRGPSGRVASLDIRGELGRAELRGDREVRTVLGGLRSSLIDITRGSNARRLTITGAGHGHGVGMCQTGAMGMADAGKSHGEILAHYYRHAEVQRFW